MKLALGLVSIMEIDTAYPPTIPVYLNHRGPFTFLLDTGYKSASLSRTVADDLSLTVDDLGCVVLDAFAVGDLVLPGYQIYVRDDTDSPLSTVRGRWVAGFLGMGFFRYYEVTLDYPGARACFVSLTDTMAFRPEPGFSYARVKYSSGLVVVPVQLNDRGPYHFLLDTGAQTVVVSPTVATELGLMKGVARTAHGVGDSLSACQSEVASLQVGTQRAEHLQVTVMDCRPATAAADMEIDGYLGHNFLQHFAVRVNVLGLWLGLGRPMSQA